RESTPVPGGFRRARRRGARALARSRMSASRQYLFLLALLIPAMPLRGYFSGNNYYALIVGIVVIALLDFAIGADRRNPAPEAAAALEDAWVYRAIVYVCAAADLALLVWGASVVGTLAPVQAAGLMLSVGFVTGAQGITIAHELGHKRAKADRLL